MSATGYNGGEGVIFSAASVTVFFDVAIISAQHLLSVLYGGVAAEEGRRMAMNVVRGGKVAAFLRRPSHHMACIGIRISTRRHVAPSCIQAAASAISAYSAALYISA